MPILSVCLCVLCGCAGHTPPRRNAVQSDERQFAQPKDGDWIAIFDTSLGEIRAVLYPDAAPMAVENFTGMARTGYYSDTPIWRVEYGFAVQGGDATGSGSGGATIWSNNPYPIEPDPNLRHYAGALCTAPVAGASPGKNGANSQFYFVCALPNSVDRTLQDQMEENGYSESQISAYVQAGGLPYLDNTDTVFGQIYQGMDVVDKMACVKTQQDEAGHDTHRPYEDTAITIEGVTVTTYPGPTSEELTATATPLPEQTSAP